MEEISNENIEGQRETKTSWTNQIVVLDKTLVKMINQQVMIKYPNHDYVDSQLLDCGVDKLMMSKQDFADMMTQDGSKAICNVRPGHQIQECHQSCPMPCPQNWLVNRYLLQPMLMSI